jgi:ATP-dependent Clp protease protease subunit
VFHLADEKKSRIIMLYALINKDSAKAVVEEILKINKEDNERERREKDFRREPIELIVNSNGGTVYDGLSIVAAIDSSKTPIHTYVYGYAMSMGLLIAVSGHKRFGSRFSTYMYHQISTNPSGKIEEISNSLEESLRLETVYDEYLLSRASIPKSDLDETKKLKMNWYISSAEALRLNLIDELI